MANEVKVSMSLSVDNGAYSDRFTASGIQSDQATQLGAGGVVTVGTSVTTLSILPVADAGYAAFRNLNTQTSGTHYVSIGAYVGTNLHAFARLDRNMSAIVPLHPTITIGVQSFTSTQYTSSARLQYLVLSR
jgi:hypothetical protein